MSEDKTKKLLSRLNSSSFAKKKFGDGDESEGDKNDSGGSARDGTKLRFGKFGVFAPKPKKLGEKDEETNESPEDVEANKDLGKKENIFDIVNTNKDIKKLRLEEEELKQVIDLGYMTVGAGETVDASIIAIADAKTMTPAVLPKNPNKKKGSARGM